MKKILLFLILLIAITHSQVAAATISATPTTTLIDKLKKIEILKEKIATKVAEIREKEKKGIGGTIKSATSSSFILTTKSNQEINISFSEDTVFYTSTASGKIEAPNKKIKEGDRITAFGYFDAARELLSAKYIYFNRQQRHVGKIANIDKANYTITLKVPQEIVVDIETYSKLYTQGKDKGLTKSGFSKLKIGDIVHLWGLPNPKEEKRFSALRLFYLPLPALVTPSLTP